MTLSDHATAEGRCTETLRRYGEAFAERDLDRMLDCFADDAVLIAAPGEFVGIGAVKEALDWDIRLSPTVEVRGTGVGLVVKDHVGVWERVIRANFEGIAYEYPIVTVFAFDDDAKISRLRAYYDKLGIEQQVAAKYPGVKGWIFNKVISYLVAQGETGLDHSYITKA